MAEYTFSCGGYELLLNSTILYKCFFCKLWENSKLVCRQLEKIGPALASSLVDSGKISFNDLKISDPRDLEMVFVFIYYEFLFLEIR